MTVPAAAVATSDSSSATPLENDVGAMFGDFGSFVGEESPESGTTSAAGTTPAEPVTETVTEPSAATEPAGATATPPPSDGSTPAAAEPLPVEDDPFKDTTPATYVVDGKSIPVEDIRVFKEGGAVIRPEALPNILSKLASRDTLEAKERWTSQQYQTLEKVVEWTDPSNNKTFTGPEAAIEMRVGNASLYAENKLLVDTLLDPDKLFQILTTEQVADGKGGLVERVIINPSALAQLQRENLLQQRELSSTIRDHYKGVLSAKPAEAPIDYAAEAPKLVALFAQAQNLDASVLTQADRTLLAKQLPFHVRDGKASVEWQELVKDRITDRQAQKEQNKGLVTATEKATKEGQARMLQAARGVKSTKAPVSTPPVKPTQPEDNRAASEGELFDAVLRSGSRALRSR